MVIDMDGYNYTELKKSREALEKINEQLERIADILEDLCISKG